MIFASKKIVLRLPRFDGIARTLVLLALCRRDISGSLHLDSRPACSHLGLSYPLSDDDRKGLQKRVLNSGLLTIHMLTLAMGEMQEANLQEQ